MAAAFIPAPTPLYTAQRAGITIPADSRVTALVPSESAIRRLSPEDQAFWMQPRMLPRLVRWAARASPGRGLLWETQHLSRGSQPGHVSTPRGGAESQRSP